MMIGMEAEAEAHTTLLTRHHDVHLNDDDRVWNDDNCNKRSSWFQQRAVWIGGAVLCLLLLCALVLSPASSPANVTTITAVDYSILHTLGPIKASPMSLVSPSSSSSSLNSEESPFNAKACEGPFPGYPYCEDRMKWLSENWNRDAATEQYYRSQGVDGSRCSYLTFLNLHGFYCPEAKDAGKTKIRGVNLGGWLVLEPWITPSLFRQFDARDNVMDQWRFCEVLGKLECKKQLEKHWDTWVNEIDIKALADAGINHVRIPFGYWAFGDIRQGEPWVDGELPYLKRVLMWCSKYGLHAVLDMHAVPGSQNGFDNSGRRGVVAWADSYRDSTGRMRFANIQRSLDVLRNVTRVFCAPEFQHVVAAIEPVNEALISVPIEIVKDYYLQAYEIIKRGSDPEHDYDIAVVIGDSFRFDAWNGFMFPPHYRHVWIDTHIYQVFDTYRLQYSWEDHERQTCASNKAEVSVAPLSTLVGEWSLATTDCAEWLNGYHVGARYDGTMYGFSQVGVCDGQNDVTDPSVFTNEYKAFLKEWASLQMDAYESGSSAGWFFWNFKTESAPQWDYLLGVQQGWMPIDHNNRGTNCDDWLKQHV